MFQLSAGWWKIRWISSQCTHNQVPSQGEGVEWEYTIQKWWSVGVVEELRSTRRLDWYFSKACLCKVSSPRLFCSRISKIHCLAVFNIGLAITLIEWVSLSCYLHIIFCSYMATLLSLFSCPYSPLFIQLSGIQRGRSAEISSKHTYLRSLWSSQYSRDKTMHRLEDGGWGYRQGQSLGHQKWFVPSCLDTFR